MFRSMSKWAASRSRRRIVLRRCGVAVCLVAAIITRDSAAAEKPLRVGMIGLDTSHCQAFTEAFTLPIPSVDGAPLCLSALIREHLYGLPDDLIVAIGKHYLFALLRQVMTSS